MLPPTTYRFACPRCDSHLETHGDPGQRTVRCPTCGGLLQIEAGPADGGGLVVKLLDTDRQDPTPLHAYAASGQQAPAIVRDAEGDLRIVCSRCGAQSDIDEDVCPSCGVPFTLEGAGYGRRPAGFVLAAASLLAGVVTMPVVVLWAVGVLPSVLMWITGLSAVWLGAMGWARGGSLRDSGPAMAGLVLGLLGLAAAVALR